MPQFYAMLKPVEENKDAYYLQDVYKLFTPNRRKTFDEWLVGKTLLLVNDKEVIRKDDLERFFDGVSR